MDTDSRERESGEQFKGTASETEIESLHGGSSVPGTATESNTRPRLAIKRACAAKQGVCDKPGEPGKEVEPTCSANNCQGKMRRDGQEFYPRKLSIKRCCARNEICQVNRAGDSRTSHASRHFPHENCGMSPEDHKNQCVIDKKGKYYGRNH